MIMPSGASRWFTLQAQRQDVPGGKNFFFEKTVFGSLWSPNVLRILSHKLYEYAYPLLVSMRKTLTNREITIFLANFE